MKLRHGPVAAACAAIAVLAASPAASAVQSPNLLVNGGAEFGDASLSGYSAVTIPGWRVSGTPTVIPYGAARRFPTKREGPARGGNQFFGAGAAGSATLSQSVNLSGAAPKIDAGAVPFTLSGWLGGYLLDPSSAKVTVTFLDANGQQLGRAASIGPVTPMERHFSTELLRRSTSGTVPAGTRHARVVVSFADHNPVAHNDSYVDAVSLTVGASLPEPSPPTPPRSKVGRLDHVFVIYMEDKGDRDIVGSSLAPYINSLINKYGFASNYRALAHPSDPNYIAVLGGSDFGIHTDCSLSCMVNKPNLLDNIEAAGRTWAFFEESMPSPCYKQTAGRYYAPDELPWAYFSDIADNPARCRAHVLPMGDMRADLASPATTPNFVWAEPNACDDMKQCGVAAGDRWLQQAVSQILNSEAWNAPTQRSAIFLTWDEDYNNLSLGNGNEGNSVPMIVIPSSGSHMRHGRFTATGDYDHYSLLRTIEAALGLPSLTDNDKYATPLNQFWP